MQIAFTSFIVTLNSFFFVHMTIILIINNNSGNTEEHMHINSVKRFGPETKPRGSDAGNKVEGDKIRWLNKSSF